jgi:2-octaprenyl-3-methyl-6-methoxy-1,4-benzoquinol hydroxylase
MADALVVGGSIVGSALALGLRRRGAEVLVLDRAPPADWREAQPDLRVYAIAADSQALLESLGVWGDIRRRRACAYSAMRVSDAGGGGEFNVQSAAMGVPQLGHIVEHALIAERLQAALLDAGVRIEREATLVDVEGDDEGVAARLADGRALRARWLFGADGARSAVREALGIEVDARDYGASGLVAYLRSERPHESTCWQRFLPTGPLALLPCTDGRVSIVWSLPEAEAQRLAAVPVAQFDAEISRASDRALGALSLDGERRLFPLKRQLALRMHRGRCALLGDAAHVVHPLAGQGVNLGLRDAAALLDAVDASRPRGEVLTPARLERWARARMSENAVAAHAFETIHRVYSNDAALPLALRGWALAAANLPPLKRFLWRTAAGLA